MYQKDITLSFVIMLSIFKQFLLKTNIKNELNSTLIICLKLIFQILAVIISSGIRKYVCIQRTMIFKNKKVWVKKIRL